MASNNKMILREVNVDVLNDCLNEILPKFNVEALTESQFNALYNFMQGRDVFVTVAKPARLFTPAMLIF